MTCHEAAEFVSALYDGETIPRGAAQHIGGCEVCRGRLKEYLEIGVELRRVASLDIPERVRERAWDKPQRSLKTVWRKGFETMRIPRFTFALMSVGIVVLASSLAVVGVRAHGDGKVVMLHFPSSTAGKISCPLVASEGKPGVCGGLTKVAGGTLAYEFKLLRKDGPRLELAVRSKVVATGPVTYSPSSLADLPEKRYAFEPGDAMNVELAGVGTVPLTGEWMDHFPSILMGNSEIDPTASELRMVSPLLLRNKAVVGDLNNTGASSDKPEQAIEIYMPGEGRFQISRSALSGAVPGHVNLNRLTFAIDGNTYEFVTGAPIARAEELWVLHESKYKPVPDLKGGFLGTVDVPR